MSDITISGGLVPCPHCGAMLSPQMVAAIRDPKSQESCPVVSQRIHSTLLSASERKTFLGLIAERRGLVSA